MDGLEELIKNGYMDPKHPVKLMPTPFGKNMGELNLGETTFGTLQKYLNISSYAPTLLPVSMIGYVPS